MTKGKQQPPIVAGLAYFLGLYGGADMSNTKITILPKRQYYSLQQAADELNRKFKDDPNQPLIDADYILHLGATGELQFYVFSNKAMSAKPTLILKLEGFDHLKTQTTPKQTLEYVNHLLVNEPWSSNFWQVDMHQLSNLYHSNSAKIYAPIDILIKNYGLIFQPIDKVAEMARMLEDLKKSSPAYDECLKRHGLIKGDKPTQAFLNDMTFNNLRHLLFPYPPIPLYEPHAYIPLSEVLSAVAEECKEDDCNWYFELIQNASTPDIKIGQEVTRKNVFVFSHHLEALIDGDREEAKPKQLIDEQEIRDLNLHVCNLDQKLAEQRKNKSDAIEKAQEIWKIKLEIHPALIALYILYEYRCANRKHLPATDQTVIDWIKPSDPIINRRKGRLSSNDKSLFCRHFPDHKHLTENNK